MEDNKIVLSIDKAVYIEYSKLIEDPRLLITGMEQ